MGTGIVMLAWVSRVDVLACPRQIIEHVFQECMACIARKKAENWEYNLNCMQRICHLSHLKYFRQHEFHFERVGLLFCSIPKNNLHLWSKQPNPQISPLFIFNLLTVLVGAGEEGRDYCPPPRTAQSV
jgi:hypothetical protein